MGKTIIKKETTNRGDVVLTFAGTDHAEGMWFKDEEEFENFLTYLTVIVKYKATSIEMVE